MSTTYYTSLSGMLAASYGLQNTSNNVANMQSPGFKRNDVFYSSLGNGNGEDSLGSGVRVAGKAINFQDGHYLESNNPSDLAIVGQGFFVIRLNNGELLYTRDGEFGFNKEGILIDKHSSGQVLGYDNAGNLVPIHEKGPKISSGKATHELFINGKFVRHEKTETEPGPYQHKYENITFKLYKIYDAKGKEHTLTLEFESTPVLVNSLFPGDDLSWNLVNISCDDAEVHFTNEQKIIFESINAGVTPENNRIQFTLNDNQPITLNFGDFNDGADGTVELSDSKNNPEGTQIKIYQNDGYGEGKQIGFSFDENGLITYSYDNGQTIAGIHVGLARFDDLEHNLIQTQDNLFRAKSDKGLHFGRANKNGFGAIKAQQLESSNVDSTTEFANIVILQRMFQACSQIMDIDKQLLEELESKS